MTAPSDATLQAPTAARGTDGVRMAPGLACPACGHTFRPHDIDADAAAAVLSLTCSACFAIALQVELWEPENDDDGEDDQ